ncbi:glycosyltransferase [Candidatus Saccharibacteria bacterium]|nr:glycosyltransferase [Candidatus Saccharibacteria bacterium]
MKVALVCDWLTNVGGAEKVLLRIHQLFPEAPIYTSKYDPEGIDWFKDADVRTGRLQKYPTKMRRILGPLRQRYFSHLDLSEYDLVISVTGAEAKAVKVPNGVHISYCHVPTQYYWQMYDDYVKNPGFGVLNPFVRFFFKLLVVPLRKADLKSAQRPDYFVTISEYAKEQIKKYYGRDAVVIHPPVEIEDFKVKKKLRNIKLKNGFDLSSAYITTSRQVNWKRIDLAVSAAQMSQRHLVVVGEGPEHKKLVKMAEGSTLVQFLPLMKKDDLAKYLSQAKGYLFPSLEPFGIAPVEALAAGCPVIAFGEGGAKDYIKNGKNGVLFEEQNAKSLAEGILKFEQLKFDRAKVAKSVDNFSLERFDREFLNFVKKSKKHEKSK